MFRQEELARPDREPYARPRRGRDDMGTGHIAEYGDGAIDDDVVRRLGGTPDFRRGISIDPLAVEIRSLRDVLDGHETGKMNVAGIASWPTARLVKAFCRVVSPDFGANGKMGIGKDG